MEVVLSLARDLPLVRRASHSTTREQSAFSRAQSERFAGRHGVLFADVLGRGEGIAGFFFLVYFLFFSFGTWKREKARDRKDLSLAA